MFIGSFTDFGSKMASKPCVFLSESIAHGRSNAGAVLLLHSTTAGSITKSETKPHESITKTLHNDVRLSLIGLRYVSGVCPNATMSVFGGVDNELCCTISTGNLSIIGDCTLYLSQGIHVQCH